MANWFFIWRRFVSSVSGAPPSVERCPSAAPRKVDCSFGPDVAAEHCEDNGGDIWGGGQVSDGRRSPTFISHGGALLVWLLALRCEFGGGAAACRLAWCGQGGGGSSGGGREVREEPGTLRERSAGERCGEAPLFARSCFAGAFVFDERFFPNSVKAMPFGATEPPRPMVPPPRVLPLRMLWPLLRSFSGVAAEEDCSAGDGGDCSCADVVVNMLQECALDSSADCD